MGFPEVIKYLREQRGYSQQQLADSLGLTRSAIGNYESGTSSPNLKMLLDIVRFFDVSSDYLLGLAPDAHPNAHPNAHPTGQNQNEKYISDVQPEQYDRDEHLTMLKVSHRAGSIRTNTVAITVDATGNENIVMVDVSAAASYPQRYLEPSYYKEMPLFSFPGPDFRNGTFRAFQVAGESMAPTFQPRDWIIASYVAPTRYDDGKVFFNIREGYVHVIVTHHDVLIKRVVDRVAERGTLALQSDNEDYRTIEIDAADVLELWYVKARVSFQFPNTRFAVVRKVSELEADVSYLKKQVEQLIGTEKGTNNRRLNGN